MGICRLQELKHREHVLGSPHARGGGGSTPLYKPYRYVPPHRVGFLRRVGLKTDVHFSHLMVWNRVWFSREPRSV